MSGLTRGAGMALALVEIKPSSAASCGNCVERIAPFSSRKVYITLSSCAGGRKEHSPQSWLLAPAPGFRVLAASARSWPARRCSPALAPGGLSRSLSRVERETHNLLTTLEFFLSLGRSRSYKQVQHVQLYGGREHHFFVVVKARQAHHPDRGSHRGQLAVYLLHYLPGEGRFRRPLLVPGQRVRKELHGLLGQGNSFWRKDKTAERLFRRLAVAVLATHNVILVSDRYNGCIWSSMRWIARRHAASSPSAWLRCSEGGALPYIWINPLKSCLSVCCSSLVRSRAIPTCACSRAFSSRPCNAWRLRSI